MFPEVMDKLFIWIGFHVLILSLLVMDLCVWRNKTRVVKMREALLWTLFWILLSLSFNLFIYFYQGKEAALQFFTGYLVEKSLSVDNLFVFLVIFAYFKIPKIYQHKVLFFGIFGALVMRIAFILGGIELLQHFSWMTYLFGVLLCATAIRVWVQRDKEVKIGKNFLVNWFKKFFPVTEELHGSKFFIRHKAVLYMTPLFLALIVVEATDIIFAIDSIPAIFAITTDPFIVYTSNVFAILGLRSVHFVLEAFMDRFHYLKVGLAAILLFVGVEMLMAPYYRIPVLVTLSVIVSILGIATLFSIAKPRRS